METSSSTGLSLTPPRCLPSQITQAMAVRADAVVLVARAGVTRKRALIRARDLLWRINAPVCRSRYQRRRHAPGELLHLSLRHLFQKLLVCISTKAQHLPIAPTGTRMRKRENNMAKTFARATASWILLFALAMTASASAVRQSRSQCRAAPEDRFRRSD